MIFCNLGSGSKGNSSLIKSSTTAILIDQGFSIKQLVYRMNLRGIDPREVEAIVLTHEHTDHVSGVAPFARRYRVPVYMTRRTFETINQKKFYNVEVITFQSGDTIKIGDILVKTFHIPHDAADPIGLVVSSNGKSIGVLTDIGSPIESLLYHIRDVNLLLLESNHDVFMLLNGPYPLNVIRRIKSRVGHLSNDQAVSFFSRIRDSGNLEYLVLGHLSETNNDPSLVKELFEGANHNDKIKIEIASQDLPTALIEL